MKKSAILLILTLFLSQLTVFAKENKMNSIRLIYPQWQGGNISSLIPNMNEKDSSMGYYLGSKLLNFLAPKTADKTITVPVSKEYNRIEKDGVLDRDIIVEQTKAALKILNKENPDKIVTLGGECSVSVVPFVYFANKYKNDVAVIWIDAHPDITLPSDNTYNAYHAMAVTAIMGKGDEKIISTLPAKIPPEKILFVGLRDWERQQIKDRQIEYGMKHLTVEDVKDDSGKIIEWINQTGAKHILIHFDMDVLDPNEIIPAVGIVDNGMKTVEAVRVINDISKNYTVSALTIAEPMPRIAIKLRNMLNNILLLKR